MPRQPSPRLTGPTTMPVGVFTTSPDSTITFRPGDNGPYIPPPPPPSIIDRGRPGLPPQSGGAPLDLISFRNFGASQAARPGAFISQAPFRGSRSGFDSLGFLRLLFRLFGG